MEQLNNKPHNHTGLVAGLAFLVLLTLVFFYLYGAGTHQNSNETMIIEPSIQSTIPDDAVSEIEYDIANFDVETLETTSAEVDTSLAE